LNIRASLLVLALLAIPNAVSAAEDEAAAATAAALAWLALVDRGDYAASWDEAASLFRARIGSADWVGALTAARTPLGPVGERQLLSARHVTELPGVPDGDYVILQFQTGFANKARAIETVTPMLDGAQWRVSGYFIK
jgi:Protein of unknown function (DUF4019)